MAEIATGTRTGRRCLSTRVDLTPMVDLGFLLITFFIYTTTMTESKAMEVNMPIVENTTPTQIGERVALTIILGKDHQVYFYEGIGDDPAHPPLLTVSNFTGQPTIRRIINEKLQKIEVYRKERKIKPTDHLTILIKPDAESKYEDLVNILDEMSINEVKTYFIMNLTQTDRKLMDDLR
jgi:biopolymer transport protein ExbD